MALTALCRFKNCCDDIFRIAMTREKELALLRGDVSDVTRFRPDVKNGRADRQNVVDLARVNNANKLVTHNNNMKISSRQRI